MNTRGVNWDAAGLEPPGMSVGGATIPDLPMPPRFEPPPGLDRADSYTPMEDQGPTSRCVAFAFAECVEANHWRTHGWPMDYDADPIYKECKKLDGIPDTRGTYQWAAVQALRNLRLIPPETRAWTLKTPAQFQWALMRGMYVCCGFRVTDAWAPATVNKHGKIPDEHKEVWGLHEVVILQFSPWGWGIGNSWGRSWGHDGMALMSHEAFEHDQRGGTALEWR